MEDTYTRREEIKSILEDGKKITAFKLAEKFEVSVNTIKNDISFISKKMKIISELGCKGGYRYVGDRFYRLNEDEAEYVRTFMKEHESEAADDMFYEVLSKLKKKP